MNSNPIRIIPRLDIKSPNLVKGIQLEGLRKLGDPNIFAKKYYEDGADEILYMDIVASLYNRNSLGDVIARTVNDVFVPVSVGGGIRSVEDARNIFLAGADKIAINTASIKRPELITEIAELFGCQAMVLSIEAKKVSDNRYECYYDNGREHTGIDVLEWIEKGIELGCGEILLTSVDKEGTFKGFDIDLLKKVIPLSNVPIIISGGCGSIDHIVEAIESGVNAIAIAGMLHYNKLTIKQIKEELYKRNIDVRMDGF
jgi:cyclase